MVILTVLYLPDLRALVKLLPKDACTLDRRVLFGRLKFNNKLPALSLK